MASTGYYTSSGATVQAVYPMLPSWDTPLPHPNPIELTFLLEDSIHRTVLGRSVLGEHPAEAGRGGLEKRVENWGRAPELRTILRPLGARQCRGSKPRTGSGPHPSCQSRVARPMCQGRWSSTLDDLTLPQLSNLQLVTVPVLVWLLPVPYLECIWRGVHCWLHSHGSPSTATGN